MLDCLCIFVRQPAGVFRWVVFAQFVVTNNHCAVVWWLGKLLRAHGGCLGSRSR